MAPEIERIAGALHKDHISLAALSACSGVPIGTISTGLRGLTTIPPYLLDRIMLALEAMQLIGDETHIPPDWRQAGRMKPLVAAKIAEIRKRREAI